MSKSVSIADLRKIRVDVLKDKSLDELTRLGGVSLLILPPGFAAAQLAVPVGICATAAYILQHGKLHGRTFCISRWLTYSRSQHARHLSHQRPVEHGQQAL